MSAADILVLPHCLHRAFRPGTPGRCPHMGTDAYQNENIVYLAHPAAWYTAEGGINALDVMLKDLESVLLSK